MATTIPTALRSADIARFALRAGQLEKAKPIVAYWCRYTHRYAQTLKEAYQGNSIGNYWIVNQILAKGLHNSDDESMTYTMHLMDKLEQTKLDHGEDDAIADDLAGQAYIEQFGFETLQRAEKAMKLNKSTRQTADTLQASATFLELCQTWGPLEPDVASKIKFAKYHAVRIVRALKAGEDPNLSNPAPESPPVRSQVSNESGFQDNDTVNNLEKPQPSIYQPFVEDVPDEHDQLAPHLAHRSTTNDSRHDSRSPSQSRPTDSSQLENSPPAAEKFYNTDVRGDVSPLGSAPSGSKLADEGGYFPSVPYSGNNDAASDMPKVDQLLPPSAPSPYSVSTPSSQVPGIHQTTSLESFPRHHMDQPSQPQPFQPGIPTYPVQPSQTPRNSSLFSYKPPPPQPESVVSSRGPQPPPMASQQMPIQASFMTDEEAMMKAQKHAKFAISALNFEDVNTAVKELRSALDSLGSL